MERISGSVFTAIAHGMRRGDIIEVSGAAEGTGRTMLVRWANGNQMICVPYRWYHKLWDWIKSCWTF